MKLEIYIAIITVALSFHANADGQTGTNGCHIPVNHIGELPVSISNTISNDQGIESLITLPMSGDPKALILVTAPLWSFQCHTVEEINKASKLKDFSTSRQLVFWATKDSKWIKLDHIGNPNVIWPLDTSGNVSVTLIRDGDTTFRLVQESDFQRVSFSDNLSFKYDHNGKFRITNWVSNSHYVGMYDADTNKEFEAKQKVNPGISDFDGYEGEIDYVKNVGWITKYKFEEVPVKRTIAIVTEPTSLENLKKLFFLPSFDCSKATTRVELAICNNENLSNSDSALDDIFKKLKSSYGKEKRDGLIVEQRSWLKQREAVCTLKDAHDDGLQFEACLDKFYRDRNRELKLMLKTQRLNDR